MRLKLRFVRAICLYLVALVLLHGSLRWAVRSESIEIVDSAGRPCPATVWTPLGAPRAIFLAGHGVTANQGIMAFISSVFARNGYASVAFDFSGHGRSRERFNWGTNSNKILAWCAWARERFPGLPMAYLGYSMGGFSGTEVFLNQPIVEAFIALGALPRQVPACPTLVAAGRFEELFTIEQARRRMEGKGDVVSSPFSDHALEAHDPLLIQRILFWTHHTLGFSDTPRFPWFMWVCMLIGLALGIGGALGIAANSLSWPYRERVPIYAVEPRQHWYINPYRIAGFFFNCRNSGIAPTNGGMAGALVAGVGFAVLLAALLSLLLDRTLFTCSLNHPERLLTWGILTLILVFPMFFDAWALERLAFRNNRKRFAVAALTRALPLLVLCLVFQGLGRGIAFAGMMAGILAFVMVMLSLAYTVVVRAVGDWRAGAAAITMLFAWLIAFWFPLAWPWIR